MQSWPHRYTFGQDISEQSLELHFFPKDINLGELMSTVYSVHVGGWAGVGACSAEGVGGPAGSAGGRLGVDWRSFGVRAAGPVPPPPCQIHII